MNDDKIEKIDDLVRDFIDSLPRNFLENCVYGRLGFILNQLDGDSYKEFVSALMNYIAMGHELIDEELEDSEFGWFTVSSKMRDNIKEIK